MLVNRVWRWWVVGWILAAGAAAQAPPPAPSGSAVEWSHGGVSFVSADHANVLQVGALVQGDGRFALAVPASAPPPGRRHFYFAGCGRSCRGGSIDGSSSVLSPILRPARWP